ncbi:hypothetical protein [Streptomyces sp. NBC_00076]|uniref:hypothetical protein n=1 Tax=Streptomyces sp. NBC_00076 TaxID=2975642 RepID=UPI003247C127
MHRQRRRHRRGALAGALVLGLLAPLAATAPAAADNSAIGYPVYSGSAEPVPELPAGFTTHGTLRAQYEADRKAPPPSWPTPDCLHDSPPHDPLLTAASRPNRRRSTAHARRRPPIGARACPNPPPADAC